MECNNPCDLMTANKLNNPYTHTANKAVGPNYDVQTDKNIHTANKAVGPNYDLQTEKNKYDSSSTEKSIPQRYEMGNEKQMNTIYVNVDKSISYGLTCQKIMEPNFEQNNMETYQNMIKLPTGYGSNTDKDITNCSMNIDNTRCTYNILKTVEMPYQVVNTNTNCCTSNSNVVQITGNDNLTNSMNLSINTSNYESMNTNVTCASSLSYTNMTVDTSQSIYTSTANNFTSNIVSINLPSNINNAKTEIDTPNKGLLGNNSNTGVNITNVTSGNTSRQNTNVSTNQCCNIESCPNNVANVASSKKGSKEADKKDKSKEKDGKEKRKAKKPKGKRICTPPSDPDSLLALPETRQKWSHLTLNEKAIAVNVYKYVKKTMPPFRCRKDIIKTVAEIVGVSVSTVYGILKEYKSTGKVTVPPRHPPPDRSIVDKLDDGTLTAIRKKVNELYLMQNKLPSLSKVLAAVNDDQTLPSFSRTTMYRILKKMNFTTCRGTKGISKGSLLLDRPNLMMLGDNKDLNTAGTAVSVIRGANKPRKATKKQKETAISDVNMCREQVQTGFPVIY